MMSGTRHINMTDIEDDDKFDDNVKKYAYHLAYSDSLHFILTQVQFK